VSVGCLLRAAADPVIKFGPSIMVILSAISCEYEDLRIVPPADVLRGLASRLASYTGEFVSSSLRSVCSNFMVNSFDPRCMSPLYAAHFIRL
jgi:hypothetical protein